MICKGHMQNGSAARPVHPRAARCPNERIMLAELRIDPSDSVLDSASSGFRLTRNFFRTSPLGFETESNMPAVKQFLDDCVGKVRSWFLQAELLRESRETII
jgi:hypothetical protein